MTSVRLSRDETDLKILDVAAGLLASHGITGTSMQALAAGTGYSKAAMFARFETKDRLVDRVIARSVELAEQALAVVDLLPEGPERDRLALASLTDIGLAHPGFMSLVVASVTTWRDEDLAARLHPVGDAMFGMFNLPRPPAHMDVRRGLAVSGGLGALAVLVLNHTAFTDEPGARAHIIQIAAACLAPPVVGP